MEEKQVKHINSPEVVERLVEENYGLILHIVNTFAENGSIERRDFDDAVWYAIDGLLKAAQNFNESRGFTFSTYACTCIKNSIIAFIRDKQKHLKHRELQMFQVEEDKEVDFFENLEAVEDDDRQRPQHQRDPLSLLLEKDKKQQFKKAVEEVSWSGNESINAFIDVYYREEDDTVSQKAVGKLYGKSQAGINQNLSYVKQADELLSRSGKKREHFTLEIKEIQSFKKRIQALA